jgi:dipeptidyl aminopeptidase/acylaminoacyl peptidase
MPQEYPIILRGFLGTVSRVDDVLYATHDGHPLRADSYLPVEAPRLVPAILFLNDGQPGSDRKTCPDLARFFGQRGLAMVSVDYQNGDIGSVVEWLQSSAVEYGLDPARIGVWGVSRGAAAALSGVGSAVKAIVAGYPQSVSKLDATLPPTLLVHGLADMVVRSSQTELLFDALGIAGCNVTMCLIEGLGHGFMNGNELDQTEFRRVRKYECRDGEPPVISEAPPFTFGTIETFFRRWL